MTKTRKCINPVKPKDVTTQMKALDEYFLIVKFLLLLKRVHFLALKKYLDSKHGGESINVRKEMKSPMCAITKELE